MRNVKLYKTDIVILLYNINKYFYKLKMLNQKRSKTSRQRGSHTHGWGHKKKHRGSGHRGGFGLAGTGARGDSQKAGLLAQGNGILQKIAASKGVKVSVIKKALSKKAYFGKSGFTSIHKKKNNTISLTYIEHNFDNLIERGIIVKEKSEFVFDAKISKVNKILGKGNFTKKLTVICEDISESAKQRIIDAGGKVEITADDEDSSEEE